MKAQVIYTKDLERRKAHRYQLRALAFFFWAMQGEPLESGEGVTRDIDTAGAYINAIELPPVGAMVQLDILLPTVSDSRPGAHLIGEGVVLRVDAHGSTIHDCPPGGFAISVQFYLDTSESVLTHLRCADRVK
jgi:hypothetical protein